MLNTLSEKADFYQKYEEEVNQLINMDEITRDEAITMIANTVLVNRDIATIDLKDYNTQLGLWSKYIGLQYDTQNRYNTYIREQNMAEIIEMVKGSEQYKLYSSFVKGWSERIEYAKISEEFEKKYGRQPEYTAADVMTVLNMTLGYSELFYKNQYDAQEVYTYLMNHVYERNSWTTKAVRVRAAYETILLWKKGYGKNIAGRENFENMADDFNSLIVDIYQLSKQGIEI